MPMNGTPDATPAARPGFRARCRWLTAGILLAILVFLTVNVAAHGPLIGLDHSIGHAIQSVAHRRSLRWVRHGPTTPARLIIDFGGFGIAFPLLGLAAVWAAVRRRSVRPLVAAAVAAVGTLGAIYVGKRLVRQATPRHPHLGPHALGSFPSGHMATACVCYFLIAVLLFPAGSPRAAGQRLARRGRRLALGAATVLCVLIGASLLWCDLHWFSDVAAGAVLAALLVMLGAWLDQPGAGLPPRPAVRPEPTPLDQAGR
jgi:membrane-associated phospholipid phosphatase